MNILLTFLLVVALVLVLFLVYWVVLRLRYGRPRHADETYAAVTPDGWKIRLFRHRPKHSEFGEPVLLVPGLIANHFEFEEPRGASLADALSARNYDVWILDPRGRRSSTPPRGHKGKVYFDDLLEHDLPTAIDFVRTATGFDQVHYVGHSLGGMLLYAYDAAYGSADIASAVTLGAPPGFDTIDHAKFNRVLKASQSFRPLLEFFARILGPVWAKVRPRNNLLPLNWDNAHRGVNGRLIYHTIEWPPNTLARDLHLNARNRSWIMLDGKIDVAAALQDLDTPLMVVCGALDPLTPLDRVQGFYDAIPHDDKRLLVLSTEAGCSADYNHIDLVVGRNSFKEVFEPIVAWIDAHPCARSTSQPKPASAQPEPKPEPKAVPAVVEAEVYEEADAPVEEAAEPAPPAPPARRSILEVQATHETVVIDLEEVEVVETDFEEGLGAPVLPGATMDELARLAREVRQESAESDENGRDTGADAEAEEEAAGVRKRRVTRKVSAKTRTKATPAKKPAAKKPAVKRRPRKKLDETPEEEE